MATNFPDTSVNNPGTSAPWADGDIFDDTAESGLIYYWYDPVWKTNAGDSSSVPDLQAVTDVGYTTDNPIRVGDGNVTGGMVLNNGGEAGNSYFEVYGNSNTNDTQTAIYVRPEKDVGDHTIELRYNGSADFASVVKVNGVGSSPHQTIIYAASDAGPGVFTHNTSTQSITDDPNRVIFGCYNVNTAGNTVSISQNGNAVLQGGILASAGNISIGYYGAGQVAAPYALFGSGTAGQYSSILDNTGITGWDQVGRTPAVFPNGTSGATGRNLEVYGGLQINLEPDNDANYITTDDVDEEGNTVENRVYNGPTLDVKERLTKADNALIALKAAATAATDFAELKAAMTTALADI